MARVLVTSSHFDTLCKDAHNLLLQNGHEVIIHKGKQPFMSFEEIAEIIGSIDGAIIGLDDWTDEVFKIAPRLKVVAKFGTGTDNIDKESAKRHGIKVINAPGINSNAVAELAIGFMVDLVRRITYLNRSLINGEWVRSIGTELRGRTIGLLGFGAISRLVARKLAGFEVKVIAYDVMPNEEQAAKLGVQLVDMDSLLSESDIISIHVPTTPSTAHLLNYDTFSKVKPGVLLINTARGAIVDSQALLRELNSGRVAGAALDVFEKEPLSTDDPLLNHERVICTPHTGGETKETYHSVSLSTAQGVVDALNGQAPQHWLNP